MRSATSLGRICSQTARSPSECESPELAQSLVSDIGQYPPYGLIDRLFVQPNYGASAVSGRLASLLAPEQAQLVRAVHALQALAPVDHEGLPGGERAARRGEPHHAGGDLVGRAEPPQR